MKFQYFTYFLNPIVQQPLFPKKVDKNNILSDILRKLKENPLEYKSGGADIAFVVVHHKDNYVVARLGKRSSLRKSLPPEKLFEETREEHWPHCNVIFNLDNDSETGQKIIFEFKNNIFASPALQLKKLAEEINPLLMPSQFVLSINPVTESQEFWHIINQNKDKIEKLSFIFNSPNLFNLENDLNEELKGIQKDYLATKATIEFENPDGRLKVPENKLTKQGVEYITKGGGEYRVKIRGRRRTVLSSKGKIKTRDFPEVEIMGSIGSQRELFSLLEKIFKE